LSQAARNSAKRIAVDKAAVKAVGFRRLDFMAELPVRSDSAGVQSPLGAAYSEVYVV
jgi:hypothetical protein